MFSSFSNDFQSNFNKLSFKCEQLTTHESTSGQYHPHNITVLRWIFQPNPSVQIGFLFPEFIIAGKSEFVNSRISETTNLVHDLFPYINKMVQTSPLALIVIFPFYSNDHINVLFQMLSTIYDYFHSSAFKDLLKSPKYTLPRTIIYHLSSSIKYSISRLKPYRTVLLKAIFGILFHEIAPKST
jgi:hypothetical protein